MAGPLDIQRVAVGLTDLLGLRATGDSPHQIGQEVRATLEMLDLYTAYRVEFLQGATANVAALGFLTSSIGAVPNGEMWLVYQIGYFSGAFAAATDCRFAGSLQRQGVSNPMPFTDTFTVTTAGQAAAGVMFPRPIVMMPRDQIGVTIASITGAPGVGITCNIYFTRLKI